MNVKLNNFFMDKDLNIYKYDNRYEDFEYVENWLLSIPESEWLYLRMLTDTPERRELTEDELCYLAEIALPMYCQELKIDELPYDDEFLRLLIGYLFTAIIVMSLKLKGFAKTDSPVKLYDNYIIEKTEKLDMFMDKNYQ